VVAAVAATLAALKKSAMLHERVLLLRFVELLTTITSDLPKKPGRTQNTGLAESKLKPPFIKSRSTKDISTR